MAPTRTETPDSRQSWLVATTGSIAMVFTFGTPISYGIFREPFSEAFGVPALLLSIVFAIFLFTFTVVSGVIGVFGMRLSSRGVLLTCASVTAALAPSLFVVESVVGLAVVFAVLGAALGTTFVYLASVVPRWFEERRGAATGLLFAGNGLGVFLLPPVWQYALTEIGVRSGFLVVLSISALAFALAGLICRRPRWTEVSTASSAELIGWLRQVARSRTFQLLFVGIALSFGWYQLLAAYAVDLFSARGLTEAGASAAFGAIGGVSIVSRIGSGYAADRVGSRGAFLASLAAAIVGIALLLVPALPAVAVAIFLMGLGLGGTATLYIPLLMTVYSPEKDTAVVGVFSVSGGVTAITMPPLGTAAVTYTGSFTAVVAVTVGLTSIGFWTIAAGSR